MTIRLHLRRLHYRFLGLFSEVRTLRTMEALKDEELRQRSILIRNGEAELHSAEIEVRRLAAQSDETKRQLTLAIEARTNGERIVEFLRGELKGMGEMYEREIHGMKQTVDCFSLQALGRQVYGTAPQVVRAKEPEGETSQRGIPVREAQRQQLQVFLDEVERRGRMEPPAQPEYSSKNGAAA